MTTKDCPRTSMAAIGKWLPRPVYNAIQRLLTWATGKPLPGQKPMIKMSPWLHLFLTLFVLVGGAVGSAAAWTQGGLWLLLLPLTMAMTLSASRTLWLTDLHAAAHGSFSRNRMANRLVSDAVSLIMLVLPWSGYRRSHTQRHHGPGFCTNDGDDDGMFLHWLGIRSGMSKRALWTRLIWGVLSPRTHLTYLAARLRVNLFGSGVGRGIATVMYFMMLTAMGYVIGWDTLLIAWVIPLTVMYQISSIVGWAGEHLWFQPKGDKIKAWHCDVTHARFMGETYPANGGALARLMWWARMAFVHLPARCLVVVGDLPAHDWHHRYPCRPEWPHAIYARQEAIDSGDNFPNETWGLFGAIDRVFTAVSAQQPQPPGTIMSGRPSELMLGM